MIIPLGLRKENYRDGSHCFRGPPHVVDRGRGIASFMGGRNAIQAMGDAGTLSIQAHPDGRWITIRIEDTGLGIPAAEMPRLFTPFHTTKAEGTGLGLAYSNSVRKNSGF
jgi:light-regulated signal transduction histidine kinase (bacteriophytochrome)